MRLLLDANAFIWWVTGSPRMGRRAQQTMRDPENDVFVGIGALWELTIKRSYGKLHFPYDFEAVLADENFETLAIDLTHLRALETLAVHHRDPFDRLLIAQAIAEGIPIATGDPVFAAYGVQIVW